MYNLTDTSGIGAVATGGSAGITPTMEIGGGRRDCNNGWGDGMGIWAILLLALLGNRGGFGFGGGNGGGDGAAAVVLNDNLNSKVDSLSSQISQNAVVDAVRAVDSQVCAGFLQTQKGFGDVALNSCQQTGLITNAINGVNTAMLLGNQQLSSQIADCCCTTQRAIDGVNYNAAKNTCDIVNAIHADGEATRGLITQNTIQDLRDKLTEANLKSSQAEQNNYLVNTLRPSPVPSYPVYSPCTPIFTPVVSAQSFCGAQGTGFGGCGTL